MIENVFMYCFGPVAIVTLFYLFWNVPKSGMRAYADEMRRRKWMGLVLLLLGAGATAAVVYFRQFLTETDFTRCLILFATASLAGLVGSIIALLVPGNRNGPKK